MSANFFDLPFSGRIYSTTGEDVLGGGQLSLYSSGKFITTQDGRLIHQGINLWAGAPPESTQLIGNIYIDNVNEALIINSENGGSGSITFKTAGNDVFYIDYEGFRFLHEVSGIKFNHYDYNYTTKTGTIHEGITGEVTLLGVDLAFKGGIITSLDTANSYL